MAAYNGEYGTCICNTALISRLQVYFLCELSEHFYFHSTSKYFWMPPELQTFDHLDGYNGDVLVFHDPDGLGFDHTTKCPLSKDHPCTQYNKHNLAVEISVFVGIVSYFIN